MVTWLQTRVSRSQVDLGQSGLLHVILEWPTHPGGVVVVANSSSDHGASHRNRCVAEHLQAAGLATACVDLPDQPMGSVASAGMRDSTMTLLDAARCAAAHPELEGLPIGVLVTGNEAMDALEASAVAPELIGAVVVRGGQPDPAAPYLVDVVAPTLLIATGRGASVVDPHRRTLRRLGGPGHLVVLSQAGPSFVEPGTLEEAAEWAAEWFVRHLIREYAGAGVAYSK